MVRSRNTCVSSFVVRCCWTVMVWNCVTLLSSRQQLLLRRVHAFVNDGVTTRSRCRRRSLSILSETTSDAEHPSHLNPILQDLNPNQVEAVTQPQHSITRVIAGPGSGKTRVLTSRIAYLLHTTKNDRILGVTFTKKAAGEMQGRLDKLMGQILQGQENKDPYQPFLSTRRVTLGTFHSVCSRILRKHGDNLPNLPSIQTAMEKASNATNLDGTFTILDQTGQLRIIKESLQDMDIDLKQHHKDVKPLQLLNHVSKIKSELALNKPSPLESKKKRLPNALRVAGKIYPLYREKLISSNCLDFDDLIQLSRELLLSHSHVREELQNVWPHVLIDEFQDTSQSQMDLVKLLTNTSLFVVGDADQSIYSWRGAHHGSLGDFETEFQDVATVYLMENYRSTSNIVKAAQKVIAESGTLSGADKLRQNMIPQRDAGVAPRIVACADAKTEVKEAVETGKYSAGDSVAFIYRTNAQSRALEEACVQMGQPYVIFGSATSFYKRQEVKDCLCFLRWLYNGRDKDAMLRAITTPKRGIGGTAIAEFQRYCDVVGNFFIDNYPTSPSPTPLDVLFLLSADTAWCPHEISMCPPPSSVLSTRPLRLFQDFSRQMIHIRDKARESTVEQVLSSLVADLNIFPHLDKISKSKEEFEERQANVNELRQASRRYDADGPCFPLSSANDGADISGSPLENFLDDVALVTEMADSSQDADGRFVANLMTIHASKGMEFDAVFLVGVEDGTIPTSQALQEGENSVVYEEEKRLCYVAMTRAKSELVMSWRKKVPIFTELGMGQRSGERSRFLDSLTKKSTKSKLKQSQNSNGELSVRQTLSGSRSRVSSQRRPFSDAPGLMSKRTIAANRNGKQPRKTDGRQSAAPTRKARASETVQKTTASASRERLPLSDNGPNRKPSQRLAPLAVTKTSGENETMASTWFFPVGSTVQHKKHGRGIVLPSATSVDIVRVRFANGDEHQFPIHGSEISPVLI